MDILRGCIEILINEMPYDLIDPNNITKLEFCSHSHRIFPQYSGDEIDYIYDYLIKDNNVSAFEIINKCATKLLKTNEVTSQIECKEGQGLRWRQISLSLGQDLFTTSFYSSRESVDFLWKANIDIEDKYVKKLSENRIAENHFHLNGSTQVFPISFACVMNNVSNQHKNFKKLSRYFNGNIQYDTKVGKYKSLYEKCVIAATIRLYLYTKLNGHGDFLDNFRINKEELYEIRANDIPRIDRAVNICKKLYGTYDENGNYIDYVLSDINDDKSVLAGERKFLHMCFKGIRDGHLTPLEQKYYFSYLVIKNQFRNELVQTNRQVGFRNFSDYQDRKDLFYESFPQYKKAAIRLAINANLDDKFINSLELRISPKDRSDKIKNSINRIDDVVDVKQKKREYEYYYVLHFPKSSEDYFTNYARHSRKRKQIHNHARAIYALLSSSKEFCNSICGIDACSNEIGCRPEVFASSFRYLLADHCSFKKLHATYHVGEEFLDIADGLRAIDEVLTFLCFGEGDRLGHALALGIDVDDYYNFKNKRLIMTKQDAIDNISWVIGKAKEYNISIGKDVFIELSEKFKELINTVYKISELDVISCLEEFYKTWFLRGDEPALYSPAGWVQKERYMPSFFSGKYLKNTIIHDDIRIKHGKLYYRYHYDDNVRIEGEKKYLFVVSDGYQKLIRELQEVMIYKIKSKKISIEANLSSNILITTVDRYDKHPIFRFVKVGHRSEGSICASINTDDLGVFDISLQNEYALLSTAMQKAGMEDIGEYLDGIREFGLRQVFKDADFL